MIIRSATLEDVPEMMEVGQLMWEEVENWRYGVDEIKLREFIKVLIQREGGIAIIAVDEGKIIGGLIGEVMEHYFNTTKMAIEYALFVTPTKRGSRAALGVMKEYIEQAKNLGVVEVKANISTGIQTERTAKFFERLGFERIGYDYTMVVG